MARRKDVVEVGDVYTNLELGLTYRVVELREEDGERLVTVETLEEGVETYRTVDELRRMIESGDVVESEVPVSDFESSEETDTVPVKSPKDWGRYLKIGGAAALALVLAGVLVPVAGVLIKVAAKFFLPVAIVALAAYLMYRALS